MAVNQIWKHLKIDESQILEGDNRGKKISIHMIF